MVKRLSAGTWEIYCFWITNYKMRIGNNPHKDKPIQDSDYLHQIIIPVFIPHFDDYFKDSFAILKICLESLFNTVHNKTFITIVNNGSCDVIKNYLTELQNQNKIHEVIHTNNIGKLNAILKGLAGNNIELVTISDADVMFLSGWQKETIAVFNALPKAGVVGIVPQFNMYKVNCSNLLFDNFFSSKLKFIPVKDKEALVSFYDSIGWKRDYNPDYLEYALGVEVSPDLNVLAGSGHFVATYKKDIFSEIVSNIPYKMGGNSEHYLDEIPLKKGYWRITTHHNYAYHLGNTIENWMETQLELQQEEIFLEVKSGFQTQEKEPKFNYFIKNKLFKKIIFSNFLLPYFYRWKKLPGAMISKY